MANPYTDLERAEKYALKWFAGLFILGIFILGIGFSKIEDLPFQEYSFDVEIGGSEKDYIQARNFQIFYDFEEEGGKIDFELSGTNYTEYIDVKIPKDTEIEDFKWLANCTRIKHECVEYNENEDYRKEVENNNIRITIFNNTRKGSESTINVTFKGKLYPNAKIELIANSNEVRIISPKGDDDGAFFIYKLGDKYQCYNNKCARSYRERELDFDEYKNIQRIKIEKNNLGEWRDISYELFYLQYDLNKEAKDKWFYLNFIGTLLAGGTISGFIVFCIYSHLKRKGNKKPR